MINNIFSNLKVLEKSLDASLLRNEVIAQNIANVDTPGYKKGTVKFEEYLSAALKGSNFKGFKTHSKHISIGGDNIDSIDIKVTQDYKDLSMRLDGNNVDIEAEMAAMAKNSIQYNTLVQSLNSKFKILKSAINEGRK
ncbi:MAG: flagellar basal body rod protein FlgB [Ruminiclostridium sp.]|nr:flagellar basal body rod protein FlgB [Ruminiclostridium sp.]